MRTVKVSADVFALIWSLRQEGEESEDQILLRILGGTGTGKMRAQRSVANLTAKQNARGTESKPEATDSGAQLREFRHEYWWQVIEQALDKLGQPSRVEAICAEVREICRATHKRIPREFEATVRATLGDNSSDSDKHKGARDIFTQPYGKHTAVWALRRWFENRSADDAQPLNRQRPN